MARLLIEGGEGDDVIIVIGILSPVDFEGGEGENELRREDGA